MGRARDTVDAVARSDTTHQRTGWFTYGTTTGLRQITNMQKEIV